MNRLLRLWRRPLVYRTAIGLYITLVLTLAGIIFAVNSLEVESAIYMRADTTLETQRTHGARGVFHHAPTGNVIAPEQMTWALQAPDRTDEETTRHEIDFVDGPAHQSWPTPTFRLPPDLEAGTWDLVVEATHDEIDDLETHHRIDVRDRPPVADSFDELRWPRPQFRDDEARPGGVVDRIESIDIQPGVDPTDDDRRTVDLEVAPSTGELIRGLDQQLFFRTFDADTGRPLAATIDLEVTSGMPGAEMPTTVRTDDTGIGAIDIRPTTSIDIEANVDVDSARSRETDDDFQTGRFELNFGAVATQYALQPASRLIGPDDEIQATVEGTLPDGTFMADLFDVDGDRFVDAHALKMTDGEGGIRFDAPDPDENSLLLRLQTYQSLYGTNHAWDSAYVVLVDDTSTDELRDVTRRLYEWIADETNSSHHRYLVDEGSIESASPTRLRGLLEAGLEEIPRTMQLPPVLMNTRDTDREALEEWREDIKSDLHLMMGVTIFAGIAVVLYFVVVAIRRYRRDNAVLQELALEDADPMTEQQRRSAKLEQIAVALQGLIVLLTLIAFAIGILLMVSYL